MPPELLQDLLSDDEEEHEVEKLNEKACKRFPFKANFFFSCLTFTKK